VDGVVAALFVVFHAFVFAAVFDVVDEVEEVLLVVVRSLLETR